MSALCHTAAAVYEPGDRIPPGNYGHVVQQQGPENHPHFYRESLFEAIRRCEFPDRPSRLDVAFIWLSEKQARDWAAAETPSDHVYAVRIADTSAPSCVLDAVWLTVIRQYSIVDEVLECVRGYWRGDVLSPIAREMLTLSDLVVEGPRTS